MVVAGGRGRARDRLDPERTGKHLARLAALIPEVGKLWLDAMETGVYSPRRDNGGRGSGFEDTDPTFSTANSRTQRQIRNSVRRSSLLIEEAMEKLESAASTLTDGFLLSDDQVLSRFLEKRAAATQRRR
jgi:hypothetical protein